MKRLFTPIPQRMRDLPRGQRRDVTRAVRSGQAVSRRADARAAIDLAEWMIRQLRLNYLDMVSTVESLAVMALLAVLGYVQTGTVGGALVNIAPWFVVLAIFRLVARVMFRHAPEGLEANREVLAGRRPPRRGTD